MNESQDVRASLLFCHQPGQNLDQQKEGWLVPPLDNLAAGSLSEEEGTQSIRTFNSTRDWESLGLPGKPSCQPLASAWSKGISGMGAVELSTADLSRSRLAPESLIQ